MFEYEDNLIYRMIKARIFHSYETFMDNSKGQYDIHIQKLQETFKPHRFTDPVHLEDHITVYLIELQGIVDQAVSAAMFGFNKLD